MRENAAVDIDRAAVDAAHLAFDLTDHEFIRNPYPRYSQLRDSSERYLTQEGFTVLVRYDDVYKALRHPKLSSDPRKAEGHFRKRRSAGLDALGDGDQTVMLMADPPDHTRLRRIAAKAFSARAALVLQPRVMDLIDDLLGEVADGSTVDLMADYAEVLPMKVIGEVFALPDEDLPQIKDWSVTASRLLDPGGDEQLLETVLTALGNLVQYFSDLIEDRDPADGDDALSVLIRVHRGDEGFGLAELLGMVILLLVAGHETTTNLIGNGFLALLRHRDQLDMLAADPALADPATEEVLRFDAPVQASARVATEDLKIGGHAFRRGEGFTCLIGAANRDSQYVPEAETFDIRRGASTHLAFGSGAHHCIGAPLARLQGRLSFLALARRFPHAALVDIDPPYRDHFVFRGLERLEVSLGDDRHAWRV